MAEWDENAWEAALLADIREHERPTSGPLQDHPLLVLHGRGARSGEPRQAILTFSRDGDAYVVAGTAGGSTKAPAWFANLRAHPDVTIEIGKRSFEATAIVRTDDAERRRLWAQHVAELPWFADYPEQAKRPIPMIRLTPKAR